MTAPEAAAPAAPPATPLRLRRRAGYAAAGLAILLAGADLLGSRPPEPGRTESPGQARGRVERGLDGVSRRFHAVERAALERARTLAEEVLHAVPHPSASAADRAALFAVLSAEGGDRSPVSGAAVVDRDGEPLAWTGRTFNPRDRAPPGDRESTRVLRTNVYKVVAAEVPLVGPGGDAPAAVRVFAPFNAAFPLHNRYLRRIDFEAEAAQALGLDSVNVLYGAPDGAAEGPLAEGAGRAPLVGILGDRHGVLEVRTLPPDGVAAVAARGRRLVLRGLCAAALLLAWALDAAGLRALRGPWARALAAVAVPLAVRAALGALGMPGALVEGDAFAPSSFSVTWLGGWLRTPGDALLTTTAVLLSSRAAATALARPVRGAGGRVLAGLGGVAVLVAGGWAATILAHAVAFQSQGALLPDERVLPTPAAAALFLAVGMLVAAGFTAAAPLLGAAAGRRPGPPSAVVRGVVVAAVASLFSAFAVQWEGLQALREDALASLDRADAFGEREERASLALLAAELAGPDGIAARVLRGKGPRADDAAFFLWAGTPQLNGRPDGCALEILDGAGSPISRFAIDIPPSSWLPEWPDLAADTQGAVVEIRPGHKGAARRRFLVAAAGIPAGESGPGGSLRLCLPLLGPAGSGARDRPEILRNYGDGTAAAAARTLHRATYAGDRLRDTTNADYPSDHRAPEEAVRRVLREGEPLVWVRESVAGTWYHNAYLPLREDGAVAGLVSVGFPSLTWRPLLLNLARVLLLHLLALAVLGLGAGVAWLARRRWRMPRPGFRGRILAGFVLVGGTPVVGLALLEQSLAQERTEEGMQREVRESLRLVEASLRDAGVLEAMVRAAAAGRDSAAARALVPDERVKEIAYRAGVPLSLFLDDALLASSDRGIFATELFSRRLSGAAYHQVVLLGREAYAAHEQFGSFPFLVGYAPVRAEDGPVVGVLSVPLLYRQDQADRDLARTTTVALALYLVVLLLVAAVGAVVARRMARPVEAMAEGTRRVAGGDLSFRIPRGPRDELGDLVDSFNRMTEGLAAGREAAARAEREAAWREMAKQVAHEIKNPLTPMRLQAQHLLRAHEDGAPDFPSILGKAVATILRQTETLRRIASDFAAFARLPRRNPEPLDVGALLRECADLYGGGAVEVTVDAGPDLPPVTADREEMRIVLVNLCGNAVEAMPSGGRLALSARSEPGASPPAVVLRVEDTGSGIAAEDLPRLFDPSFSTKTGGTGLGLAIVRRIIEDTGGTVSAESEPGRGSTFTLRLPANPTTTFPE